MIPAPSSCAPLKIRQRLKSLMFVETSGDYRRSCEYLNTTQAADENLLIVNLDSSHAFDYSSFSGIRYKTEDEYESLISIPSLESRAVCDLKSWLANKDISDFLKYHNISIPLVIEHSLMLTLCTLYRMIETVKAILLLEKPEKVILFTQTQQQTIRSRDFNQYDGLRFNQDENWTQSIVPWVMRLSRMGGKIQLKTIPIESECRKRVPAPNWMIARKMLTPFFIRVRWFINMVLKIIRAKRVAILIMGAPRIMFPLIKEMRSLRDEGYQIHYLQSYSAPRSLLWLARNRCIYHTLEDFPKSSFGDDQRHFDPDLARGMTARFAEISHAQSLFFYEGMSLFPLLESKIFYLFHYLVPRIKEFVDIFEKFFQKENFSLVIADEDRGYFSRTLFLTAKSRGVKTAEYQHGVISRYSPQYLIEDAMFVWGEFFKQRILEVLQIPETKVVVVGAPHLRSLGEIERKGKKRKSKEFIRRKLRINEEKIILYTPHAFRKGARGGMYLVHVNRRECEDMMIALVEALKGRRDVHLVIKLHHADTKVEFYQSLVEMIDADLKYSILQNQSLTPLLRACDVLVTPVSTAILEGLLINCPILLLDFDRKREIFPYIEWGAVEGVDKKETLREKLEYALNHRAEFLERFKTGRERVIKEFTYQDNDDADRRFHKVIVDMIGQGR